MNQALNQRSGMDLKMLGIEETQGKTQEIAREILTAWSVCVCERTRSMAEKFGQF